MCGRYALGLRPREVYNTLENEGMDVDEAPEEQGDSKDWPNYNIAPGYHGLVYLARKDESNKAHLLNDSVLVNNTKEKGLAVTQEHKISDEIRYKLQSMTWGLIPFWVKHQPDYGFLLKTMNCRDDSLMANSGMWNLSKCHKRCVVIAQGFYEWLKKTDKIPHYVHRKDGKLLCLAGLYDCVQYDGDGEIRYTYTIITTDSNKQLKFLHHRMPVILENGSAEIRSWLNPNHSTWSQELQSLLKPFNGELEIYPVSKDVGKLSKNSPRLIIPIASSENKSNIANFFSKGVSKCASEPVISKYESESMTELIRTQNKIKNLHQIENKSQDKIGHMSEKNTVALADSQNIYKPNKKRQLIESPTDYGNKVSRTTYNPRKINLRNPQSPSKVHNLSKGSQKITNFFKS